MSEPQETQQTPTVDWTNLPPGFTETSLWDCLHDARLERVGLDRLARTLLLEFDIWHVRQFHHLPDSTRFLLHFAGVKSTWVGQSVPWPSDFFVPDGTPYGEAQKMVDNYQAMWIEESVSWLEFEERLARENGTTEVFEASLVEGHGTVAVRLFLHVNDEFYPEFFVRAESLAISLNTGQDFSLQEFLRLGEEYWEDFAKRGRELRASTEPGDQGQ